MQLVIFALRALSFSFLSFLVSFKRFDKFNPSSVNMFAGRGEREQEGGIASLPSRSEVGPHCDKNWQFDWTADYFAVNLSTADWRHFCHCCCGKGGAAYWLDAGFVCSTNLTINVFTQRSWRESGSLPCLTLLVFLSVVLVGFCQQLIGTVQVLWWWRFRPQCFWFVLMEKALFAYFKTTATDIWWEREALHSNKLYILGEHCSCLINAAAEIKGWSCCVSNYVSDKRHEWIQGALLSIRNYFLSQFWIAGGVQTAGKSDSH